MTASTVMSTSAVLFFFLLTLHFVHNSLVTHELLLSVKTFKIILTFFEASLQLSYLTLWCDNLFSELLLRSIQTRGGTNENKNKTTARGTRNRQSCRWNAEKSIPDKP